LTIDMWYIYKRDFALQSETVEGYSYTIADTSKKASSVLLDNGPYKAILDSYRMEVF
jgi:hypothetical protein